MAKNVNEATVVACKCRKSKKTYGIRVEKKENTWCMTWAFPISDKSASNEGYDKVEVKGNIRIEPEYPGCPYCKASGWISCGRCNKLTCWDNSERESVCEWCGNRGIVEAAEHFDLSGSGY